MLNHKSDMRGKGVTFDRRNEVEKACTNRQIARGREREKETYTLTYNAIMTSLKAFRVRRDEQKVNSIFTEYRIRRRTTTTATIMCQRR